ncbi:MAG: glucosidase, partial [Verrucomicrobiota bacterium]
MNPSSKEVQRLVADANGRASWRLWGPYLAERQWGTVREDYSANGDAWASVSHDHARSKAYRWGEEGLAGLSDIRSRLCLGLALWNGKDPILKERLFGLTNAEGNHGEDVKELYYYLDATPTHSYLKYLYKYPQRAFPYAQLVDENRRRAKEAPEYELLDTGIFEDDRYFDVFVEYAKASVDDILMRVTVHNRGAEAATLHVLPQLWCRNIWSWRKGIAKPELRQTGPGLIHASGVHQFDYELVCENAPALLFTENETNRRRLYGEALASGFFKDGINDAVVGGRVDTVNPAHIGTKAAAHYVLTLGPSGSAEVRLRLKAVVKSAGA